MSCKSFKQAESLMCKYSYKRVGNADNKVGRLDSNEKYGFTNTDYPIGISTSGG